MPLAQLPHLDEHCVVVAATPEATWAALLATLGALTSTSRARQAARLLGCRPGALTGWEAPATGSTVPGFGIVAAEPPHLLVLAGEHRFSRYGIVWRIEPSGPAVRREAERPPG